MGLIAMRYVVSVFQTILLFWETFKREELAVLRGLLGGSTAADQIS